MFAQLSDGAIEGLDRAVGAGEHHSAFHCHEDEGRECVDVGAAGHSGLHFDEAFAHGFDPSLEVAGDKSVGGSVFRIDFKSEAADGATVSAVGGENALAVSSEDGEDAFEWLGCSGKGRIDDHGAKQVVVLLENGTKQCFLAVEEMIEAAGIDLGMPQQFGHAGAGKAALPEEKAG